jgi:hypothetical protein
VNVTITFITAVAPYHAHLIPAVREQVMAQTVACSHLIIEDHERQGPGAARNAGLLKADTPFVAFLDADDQIAPTWAEETLAAFEAHGGQRYIYTDHLQDDKVIAAPDKPWVRGTWHVITALLPTAWARAVGGFDPTLPAFEDTGFYIKLQATRYCGARLARPLFTYGAGGERSARHHGTPVYDAAMRYFNANYGRRSMGSCCGDPQPGDLIAIGERLDGDVKAEATWAGNRPQRGRATGRVYRTGNWKVTWIDPRDAEIDPHLWNVLRDTPEAPDFDFSSFADYAVQTGDNGGALVGIEAISDFIMRETQPPAEYEPPPVAIPTEPPPSGEKPQAATLRTKAAAGRSRRGRQSPGIVEAAKRAAQ